MRRCLVCGSHRAGRGRCRSGGGRHLRCASVPRRRVPRPPKLALAPGGARASPALYLACRSLWRCRALQAVASVTASRRAGGVLVATAGCANSLPGKSWALLLSRGSHGLVKPRIPTTFRQPRFSRCCVTGARFASGCAGPQRFVIETFHETRSSLLWLHSQRSMPATTLSPSPGKAWTSAAIWLPSLSAISVSCAALIARTS